MTGAAGPTEVTLHVVKGGGHGFGGPEIDRMVGDFFARHLKAGSEVAPAPSVPPGDAPEDAPKVAPGAPKAEERARS